MVRFIVDTYLPYDTGGPEALVQLALALHRVLNVQRRGVPHSAHVWRKQVARRNWMEYPGIADVPTIHGDLREHDLTRPGDVIIAPDVRVEACAPWLSQRGVTEFTYVLSVNFLPILAKNAHHSLTRSCRFLHHSFRLSNFSGWDRVAAVPRSLIVRPYISPSIVAFCAATRANRTRLAARAPSPSEASGLVGSGDAAHGRGTHALPLVLVDNDVKGLVRYHVARACNQSRCEVVVVNRFTRQAVMALLARASVVVDWCMVGTERLPVEAVLCGAVLLTSDCRDGGALDDRDFPMARRNLLSNASELSGAIGRVLSNLDEERRDQQRLVELYDTGTSAATMEEEVAAAVETIVHAI